MKNMSKRDFEFEKARNEFFNKEEFESRGLAIEYGWVLDGANWAKSYFEKEIEAVKADRSKLDDANIELNYKVKDLQTKLDRAVSTLNRVIEIDKHGGINQHDHIYMIAEQALAEIKGE